MFGIAHLGKTPIIYKILKKKCFYTDQKTSLQHIGTKTKNLHVIYIKH